VNHAVNLEGENKVEAKVAHAGKAINGWRVAAPFGDRNFYHGNWLLRAAAAKAGIYGKESNWLPAPEGPIYMVMRLYWPKTEPPAILPPGEGAWKPPGIVAVK
jgi:hypothetical protein